MIFSAKRDVDVARKLSSRRSIFKRNAALQCAQRDRAIHSAGIELGKAESRGHLAGDGGLAGTGRPVNGDDHVILL